MDKNKLNSLRKNTSPTFCMAKFHEATIWLYSSKIASCHHTPLLPTGNSIINFYNTREKRQQQDMMINGLKPAECNYCWKLEEQDLTSDRELKSLHFRSHLPAETYFDKTHDFKPKALELAFQNTCNLACAYCSPSFSTEWINDIKKHGVYENVSTDIKRHYARGVDNNVPVDLDMFWQWFDQVSNDLESIRITGGEPLLHEETFKTFEKMLGLNPDIECVIHTNLCQKPVVIQRFIDSVNKLKNIRINISNESAGDVAEFIRDGMVYSEWLENVRKLVTNTKARVSISTTITALSLIGLDDLYKDIIKLRKENKVKLPYIAINFATYPAFQSLACLSKEERIFYLDKYTKLFKEIKGSLLDNEKTIYHRLLSMLDPALTSSNFNELRKDADIFFSQYMHRRNKNIDITKMLGIK
jgi:organic radical activating enzyme